MTIDHTALVARLHRTLATIEEAEAAAAIESLVAERDIQIEAKEAAIRQWNECGSDLLAMTAERDALRAECERLRADLHNARLGYKEVP